MKFGQKQTALYAGDNMKFIKGYKKLYEIEKEKNYVLKKRK